MANTQAYALFVNNEFKSMMYYPSEGNDDFVRMTAALQSSPKIILDKTNIVESVHQYSVFVEEEYAGFLFILKEDPRYDLSKLHDALQNDPVIVWVNSETLPPSTAKFEYKNNILTLIEE
jgi:hypothetical protein